MLDLNYSKSFKLNHLSPCRFRIYAGAMHGQVLGIRLLGTTLDD